MICFVCSGAGATNSDATGTPPTTPTFTAPVGGTLANSNSYGFKEPPAIGDYVFNDVNANGQQDGSDTPLSGVTVELVRSGSVIASTITLASGGFNFNLFFWFNKNITFFSNNSLYIH